MKPFLVEKKRMIELGILAVMDIVLYFIFSDASSVALFSFGFIWNWTAAQDLESVLVNPRYRFSMLKFVGNVQALALRPVQRFPRWTHFIARLIPAGVFWIMVIFINDSVMPWWMTFIGSLVFEIVQFELGMLRKVPVVEDLPPPPPTEEVL